MTEYETVTRKVEELQLELYKAQKEQQNMLEGMKDVNESLDLGNVTVSVAIDYADDADEIFRIESAYHEERIYLTTEQLNRAVQFLAQFNIPINRYNEHLEAKKQEQAETPELTVVENDDQEV